MKKMFYLFMTTLLYSNLMLASEYKTRRDFFTEKFGKKKQLWVVGYVNSNLEDYIKDTEESFNNGADAIVWESSDYKKLDEALAAIKQKYPNKTFGVNFLGPDEKLMTYKETFELAKKHNLQIAWTDFSGVDLIKEAPETSLHAIDALKPADVFYVSGIHMKYSTPLDPEKTIERSALQAMGWLDGIVITGPKTGVATDPMRAKNARSVIGNHPMGAASGVSAENVKTILPYIDFVLVNTSIADKNHRIIGAKVKDLRKALDQKIKSSKN
jgi:hypothetical protein